MSFLVQWRESCCLLISWQVIHPVFTHFMTSYWNKNLISWLSSVLGKTASGGQPWAAGFLLQACELQCPPQSTGHVLQQVSVHKRDSLNFTEVVYKRFSTMLKCPGTKLKVWKHLFGLCGFWSPLGLTTCPGAPATPSLLHFSPTNR